MGEPKPNVTHADAAALAWAITQADTWGGSYMPDTPEMAEHDENVERAKRALARVKEQAAWARRQPC